MKFLIPLAVLVGIARPAPAPPMRPALASWYDDAGQTASGRHYTYGFASLQFGSEWGRRVRFCHARRCVTGRLDDHGPYVTGRLFDLNWRLKMAIACSDLCVVRYGRPRSPRVGARWVPLVEGRR